MVKSHPSRNSSLLIQHNLKASQQVCQFLQEEIKVTNKITRRNFLKVSAVASGSILSWSGIQAILNPSAVHAESKHLITAGDEKIVPSACSLCGSGCGVLVRVANGRVVKLEGSPMHPVNLGALCPKGQASPELLYNPDRLTGPMKRIGERGLSNDITSGAGQWQSISWDEAIQMVTEKLQVTRDAGHPEQTALLHGETRGQQRSFFERFMQAIGSPN